jgi:hypothetical protein
MLPDSPLVPVLDCWPTSTDRNPPKTIPLRPTVERSLTG